MCVTEDAMRAAHFCLGWRSRTDATKSAKLVAFATAISGHSAVEQVYKITNKVKQYRKDLINKIGLRSNIVKDVAS